jgi:hypothetical protein
VSIRRLARTWKNTTITVLTTRTPEIVRFGAVVRATSHSGTAAVGTRYWIAITPSSTVSRR